MRRNVSFVSGWYGLRRGYVLTVSVTQAVSYARRSMSVARTMLSAFCMAALVSDCCPLARCPVAIDSERFALVVGYDSRRIGALLANRVTSDERIDRPQSNVKPHLKLGQSFLLVLYFTMSCLVHRMYRGTRIASTSRSYPEARRIGRG